MDSAVADATDLVSPDLTDAVAVDTDDVILADLLVEEISIDGMCGVY